MSRVRFAPSPTGLLHVGGARTYVFSWLFAQSTGGRLVLRIDDTDTARNTEEYVESILEGLGWLGLRWDEGPIYQSKRRQLHADAAERLLAKGSAYRDFTPESAQSPNKSASEPWLFNPAMRDLSAEESKRRADSGEPFVVRFRIPRERAGGVAFTDRVFRKQFRKFADMEDFALLRSNGKPTYHLASTFDDGDLRITHVIRGQDHLTNTFKHILLLEALDFDQPEFAHVPLLLGPDGSKLSKRRHGAIASVTNYRDRGFLPAGFVNFLSLLGWSPKDNREVLTISDLKRAFRLEQVLRTNAVVQLDESSGGGELDPKAVWLNGQHLRSMPIEDLRPHVENAFRANGWWRDEFAGDRREWFLEAVDTLRGRLNLLTDFTTRCRAYFQDEFATDPKATANLDKEGARDGLRELADRLESTAEFTEESVETTVRGLADERGVKAGVLINGSRAALTGQPVGPSAFRVFTLVGRDRAIERLRAV